MYRCKEHLKEENKLKKKGLFSVVLLLGLLVTLTACSRGIDPEEAAPLFIHRYIYEEEKDTFNENFKQGEALSKVFNEQKATFKENFVEGLIGANKAVDQDAANEIYDQLDNQVKEVATYEIGKISTTKHLTNVVYDIKGLSIKDLLVATSQDLADAIKKNNKLAKNKQQLVETTVNILKQEIPKTKQIAEPKHLSLQLKKEKGQWEVVSGQSEELKAIYLAFFTGTDSEAQFTQEVTTALNDQPKQTKK